VAVFLLISQSGICSAIHESILAFDSNRFDTAAAETRKDKLSFSNDSILDLQHLSKNNSTIASMLFDGLILHAISITSSDGDNTDPDIRVIPNTF
jgi:hypothetical protein